MKGPINEEIFPMYVKLQGREDKLIPFGPDPLQCSDIVRRRSFRSREFKPILRLLRRDIG